MSAGSGSGEESFEEIRARTVEQLRSRCSEIERALYARVRKVVPNPVDDGGSAYRASLRATVKVVLDYALDAIERGLVSAPLPSAARAHARRAARDGVSLDRIQRGYLAVHAELGDFVAGAVEAIGVSNDGCALDHLRRTRDLLLEHVAASIEREYMQERELIARPSVQRRAETVQKLLAGEPADQTEIDRLGYQLHAHWHLGVIATGDDATDVLSHLRMGLERRLLLVPRGDGEIWGWLGGQHKLATRELERLLPANPCADFRLVIGGPGNGLDGWRQTHREARDALVAALRKPDKLVRYADTPLFAAAVQNDTLTKWLRDFLAPLRGQKDGGVGLLQTLRALINAECNRRAAAALLDVDRHTVENRLRTAEELLGRSLTTCLPELDTALRLAELDGAITATRTSPAPSVAPQNSARQYKTRTSHQTIGRTGIGPLG